MEAQAAGLRCLVSDSVTDETDITGLVKFLPLEEKIWTEALEEAGLEADLTAKARQRDGSGRIERKFRQTGYNIEAACERLIRFYESESR